MKDENIRTYIIDSSFMLAHLFPDEKVKKVDEFFIDFSRGRIELHSTQLLPFEVANGLKSAYLKKRVDLSLATELLDTFFLINITFMPVSFHDTLSIATKGGLTAYDASYICLAKQSHFPLLTLDKRLQKIIT